MPAPRMYPDELRERAIRFCLDLVDGPERVSVNAAARRVGEQLGINKDTLRNACGETASSRPGLTMARSRAS